MKIKDADRQMIDVLYRVDRLEQELAIQKENNINYEGQLSQLWNKTIGHYLEEIISWVIIVMFMVGMLVGAGWVIHYIYEVIKKLLCC